MVLLRDLWFCRDPILFPHFISLYSKDTKLGIKQCIIVVNSSCMYMLCANLCLACCFLKQRDMGKKKNPCVFLDVSIDGDPLERIVIEVVKN